MHAAEAGLPAGVPFLRCPLVQRRGGLVVLNDAAPFLVSLAQLRLLPRVSLVSQTSQRGNLKLLDIDGISGRHWQRCRCHDGDGLGRRGNAQ